MKNYIKPNLGHLRMDQINTMMLVDFISNLKKVDSVEEEASQYRRESVYKVLKSIFKYAKRWHVVKMIRWMA